MVNINYRNKEIESLFTSGKSVAYKAIMGKKVFMKAISAFKALLSIINNMVELKRYQFLKYCKTTAYSSVTIECAGVLGNVFFSEAEEGRSITIYDFIINNDYGKERSI